MQKIAKFTCTNMFQYKKKVYIKILQKNETYMLKFAKKVRK